MEGGNMPKIIQKSSLDRSLLLKLLPKIHSGDIFTLSTEQLAKLLNISKATLYKVYPNKRSIYETFITGMVDFIEHDNLTDTFQNQQDQLTLFDLLLDKLFSVELLLSPRFLTQLANNYPDLAKSVVDLLKEQEKKMVLFYQHQIAADAVKKVDPKLLVIQQKATLQYMLDGKEILKHDMTIKEFVTNFYQLQKKLLFTQENDDQKIPNTIVDHLTKKIESILV